VPMATRSTPRSTKDFNRLLACEIQHQIAFPLDQAAGARQAGDLESLDIQHQHIRLDRHIILPMQFFQFIGRMPFWQLTLIWIVIGGGCMTLGERLASKHVRLSKVLTAIGSSLALLWYTVGFVRLIRFAPSAFRFLSGHIGPAVLVPTGTLVTILIGFVLFLFRVYARRNYGVAESAFAVASIWVSVSRVVDRPSELSAWMGITASAYLLVRGLDNATHHMNVREVLRRMYEESLHLEIRITESSGSA
jgi:hypothetical protein